MPIKSNLATRHLFWAGTSILAGSVLFFTLWDARTSLDLDEKAGRDLATHIPAPPPSFSMRLERSDKDDGQHRENEHPRHRDEIAGIRAKILAAPVLIRGQIRNEEIIELFHRLAEIDPEHAIQLALEYEKVHGDYGLPGTLFAEWVEHAKSAAMRWYETLPAGELQGRIAPIVISLLAGSQPERALNALHLLQGEHRLESLSTLFTEWSDRDPATAAAFALHLRSEEERSTALTRIAEKWIQTDLHSALSWLTHLPTGSDREAALLGLLPGWASLHPEQAAAFRTTIPENSPVHGDWLRTVAQHWVTRDPDTAMRWAQSLPALGDRHLALRSAVTQLAKTDFGSAADRAAMLPEGSLRHEILELVIRQRAATDIEAVTRWVSSLTISPTRDLAASILSNYLAPTQPRAAEAWANSITNVDARQKQLQHIFKTAPRMGQ